MYKLASDGILSVDHIMVASEPNECQTPQKYTMGSDSGELHTVHQVSQDHPSGHVLDSKQDFPWKREDDKVEFLGTQTMGQGSPISTCGGNCPA